MNHHWSILFHDVINLNIQLRSILRFLHIVSEVDGYRFIIPFIPGCLVECEIIPEIESGARLEVGTSIDVIASRAAGDLAVREPSYWLKDCSSPSSITPRSPWRILIQGIIILCIRIPYVSTVPRRGLWCIYGSEDPWVRMILMVYKNKIFDWSYLWKTMSMFFECSSL